MNNSEPSKVGPPDNNDQKKIEGRSFARRNIWIVLFLVAAFIIGGVGLMVYRLYNNIKQYSDIGETGTDKNVKGAESNSVFMAPYDPSINVARLSISGGNTIFKLSDTTNGLFDAHARTRHNKYQFDSQKADNVEVMHLTSKSRKAKSGSASDSVNLKLNTNPQWEIEVESGATELDFDLSKYKLKSIKIKGGAGSFTVKLGKPLATTEVNISTGISEVDLEVPKDAACSIESKSNLSSTQFDGFKQTDKTHYETPGFESAVTKIIIHLDGSMSDYEVHRY